MINKRIIILLLLILFMASMAAFGAPVYVNVGPTTEFDGDIKILSEIVAEGTTPDGWETTVFFTDPTADRTITIPDYDVTVGSAILLTVTDNEATNENNAILFTSGGVEAGILNIESDGGDFYYNPSDGSLHAILLYGDGSNLTDVGAATATALTIDAKVNEAGGITKGQPVYFSGAVGQLPQASLADNTIDGKTCVAGIAAETKNDGQTILIRVGGQLDNLDTSAYSDGDCLYLSTAGSYSTTIPTSGAIIIVAGVEYDHASLGKLLLLINRTKDKGAPSGTDLIVRMGDNVATNKVIYKDYANNEVAYIDSDGKADFTSLTLDTALLIAEGGTNSAAALTNDRVMISSGGAIIHSATITVTELGLLNGMVSVSTGVADNDKLVTQGYVDDIVGGANVSLSNLAAVAINTSLLSDAADTDDLGSAAKEWLNLYLGTYGTVYFGTGQTENIAETAVNELTITATTVVISGALSLGANDLTMTGSLGATGARLTKVWTAALECTADITINGTALASIYQTILTNEAGLYGALSDVSDFVQATEVNSIDSVMYVDASIDHEHLAPDVISGMTDVTSADADYVLIWDATDSLLKKCDMGEVRGAGGATAWDDIGNPDANDEIDFGAFIIELNVADLRIGDGGANYVRFVDGVMTFQGTGDIDLPNNSVDSSDVNFNYAASASEAGSATSGDAAIDFFGAGVDAVTDATTCTDVEGTLLSIGGGVLNVTIPEDHVTITMLEDNNVPADEDIFCYELTGTIGQWYSRAELGIGTATAITDGLIVEADLDASAVENGDILTYSSGGTDFNWQTKAQLSIASSGANTDITSILNVALYVGRDADNQIKFATDNKIVFRVSGADKMEIGSTGELDMNANSVGFTLQTATGDGTTTIDWKLGNKFQFTFGAQNDTLTFTAPTNPGNFMLWVIQDGTGSRTITWPTIRWAGGTTPTLSTAGNSVDIVALVWDGTNWDGVASLAFAIP